MKLAGAAAAVPAAAHAADVPAAAEVAEAAHSVAIPVDPETLETLRPQISSPAS